MKAGGGVGFGACDLGYLLCLWCGQLSVLRDGWYCSRSNRLLERISDLCTITLKAFCADTKCRIR